MPARRRFGRVRKLPSGRWQARYPTPDGRSATAPRTFRTKTDAGLWLDRVEQRIVSGEWFDPTAAAATTVAGLVEHYLAARRLAPRTRTEYDRYLRRYIRPHLGGLPAGDLRPAAVNTWVGTLHRDHPDSEQPAKAYRLLHAACALAVEEQTLARNPCQNPAAGKEHHPERVPPTVAEVVALLAAIPARYHAMVTVAAYAALRWGELVNLERRDLIDAGTRLRIRKAKSDAGVRIVTLPPSVADQLADHLAEYVPAGPRARLFTTATGKVLNPSNFVRDAWGPARDAIGRPELHFHDLRHLAGTLAAVAGATVRELMEMLGHASPRAAMIYQHAASDRSAVIAAALDNLIGAGTQGARDTGLTAKNGEAETG